jgi:ribosomal-protein-alanine N-acetyltransferase
LTYTIRRMAKEDLDQVNEIDREAFPSQWPPANYHQELQNKIAHYIVVYDDAKNISVTLSPPKNNFSYISRLFPWLKKRRVQASPPPPVTRKYIIGFSGLWMMADEAHVTNLAVREEYRGKGLGELLLLATIDLAAQLNASFLTLEVRASNLVAQSLYGKYGFMQMGIRRGYYLDNREDAIIMSTETIDSEPFREQMRGLRETLARKLACNP